MLNYYARVGLAILLSQASAYDAIAGYTPGSNVVDQGNIDLDQQAIESLDRQDYPLIWADAKAIYENGGSSKSVATITFDAATTSEIVKDTMFSGLGVGGALVIATAYDTYPAGVTSISLKYNNPGTCLVGSLVMEYYRKDGCFVTSGTITDGTTSHAYNYLLTDNKAKRTLQGFSTAVESEMSSEAHANYFKEFYGVYDYADQIVTAAFNGGQTTMPRHNVDFTNIGPTGTNQIIRNGIVLMNVFMYSMHGFESSIGKCVEGAVFNQENAVRAWDEGVAFFVGNLAGSDGYAYGRLVYRLGNLRCPSFGTCGTSGTEKSGPAKVNINLIALFNSGRDELNAGNCVAATATKNAIEDLMYIPLIQSTLRYAYKIETGNINERTLARGTSCALAVLGRIHAASPAAATIIFNNMKTEASTISASAVKDAFESVYDDMNISCEDVGGLLKDDGTYYTGMEPCSTKCTDKVKGKNSKKFVEPISGLETTCGDVGVLSAPFREMLCAAGASAVCPLTCGGFCGCNDPPTNHFTIYKKSEVKKRTFTCAELRSEPNRKRNNLCKRYIAAREECPNTCQGFCPTTPFSNCKN